MGEALGRSSRMLALGSVTVVLGVTISACGSTSGSSGSNLPSSGTGSGQSNATSAATSAGSSASAGLSLTRLGSLKNYTFTTSAGNGGYTFTITGQVHDSTNWETQSTAPAVTTYDVGGRGYALAIGHVISVSFNTPEGLTHLNGETTYAKSLIGYTHVTGIQIKTTGPCNVAGVAGTTYHVQSPSADASLLVETATACVANGSGALLSYSFGVPSGSAANAAHISGAGGSFRVNSIGRVGQIALPKLPPTTTQPTLPANAGAPPGLPAGFPSQVSAPPGRIMSSVALSSTKWYVQLTENSSAALSDYAKVLQNQGFSVTNSTNSVAADIETLTKLPYQVLLEQMSLPGEGVILSVTVSSVA